MSANMDKHSYGMEESDKKNETYGVIGICGVVGNLAARVLMDNNQHVICTDLQKSENCPFLYTLNGYKTKIYLNNHPDSFFNSSKYIIPPPSLPKTSELYQMILNCSANLLEVDELIQQIKPNKPVICVTGTNGKTTTTTLLKHICYEHGLKPTEHGFITLQGNVDYIPPLQCRLKGDVAVLETGTEGNKGDLKFIMERCEPECGIITNITPDHLNNEHNFLHYADIKGEFIKALQEKMMVVNGDDPTIKGLIRKSDFKGKIISFGVEHNPQGESTKTCLCGNEIKIKETLSGVGYYQCSCGLEHKKPDYLATDITLNSFTLQTPEENLKIEMNIQGLHNIYNALGAIAAAHENLNIPLEDIQKYVKTFNGVPGRLEYIYQNKEFDLIVDYAHNPSGVETVLRELSKVYKKVAVVVTISSESGIYGDMEIMAKTIENATFIIPASYYSRKAATKFTSSGKILLTSKEPQEFREGTLGATKDQLIEGLLRGLECDADAVVCIGEAAVKYKDDIKVLMNSQMELK